MSANQGIDADGHEAQRARSQAKHVDDLRHENEQLRQRLAEAESTIDAIRGGEVDAFVVTEGDTQRVYTLEGADRPYRLLIERMRQGGVTLTVDGDIAYCNRGFADMLARPHRELIGVRFEQFVEMGETDCYESLVDKDRSASAQAEAHLLRSDGCRLPVQLMFSPLDPDSGVAIGVLITDLTSQRSYEQLQEVTRQWRINEERYRTLFHSIDEGFCVLELLYDAAGRCDDYMFVEVNPAFEKHTGVVNAQGHRIRELVPDIEREWFAIYDNVLKTGEPKRFVNESAEMSRWYSVYAFRLGTAQERRVAILFTDITQQRKAELKLREAQSRLDSTLAAAEIGTWEFDIENDRILADANLARMYGVTARDRGHLALSEFLVAIHPEDRPQVEKAIDQAIRMADTLDTGYRIVVEGRAVRHVMVRGRIERNEAGKAIRLPGVVIDITAQRIAEQSLRESEHSLRAIAQDLEDADRRKDQFLATLAHELRNPLAPIKAAAQLMQLADQDSQQLGELTALVERQADQMVRLIDDLMDVSRISRGKLKLQLAQVNLQSIVKLAVEAAVPFINSSRQVLHVDQADEALYVEGDAARLTQVISNILNNAAKYTPAAGEIWLSLRRDQTHAIVSVRDNGIGLEEASRERVFEMFEQVDASKERGQSGLGIGLSLAKTLVDLHCGSISVVSQGLGQGCCFEVQLPLHMETRLELSGDDSARDEASDLPARSLRILVVDDTRAIRFVLKSMLEKMGHLVSEAVNGQEGLEVAEQTRPEIIFSDISMPIMNGHELARAIRSDSRFTSMKLVALTGFGQLADRENAIASGFDEHIVKPIDARRLGQLLRDLS